MPKEHSNGSTASYYTLPKHAQELQDLISHRNMNSQIGEIFRACYRMGRAAHSDELRDAKKILFYAKAEVQRLEKAARSPQPISSGSGGGGSGGVGVIITKPLIGGCC